MAQFVKLTQMRSKVLIGVVHIALVEPEDGGAVVWVRGDVNHAVHVGETPAEIEKLLNRAATSPTAAVV